MRRIKLKVPHQDRCDYCGHPACDDEVPFVIISKDRFDWLMEGAQMTYDDPGDDAWVDWMARHRALNKMEVLRVTPNKE